MATIWWVSCVCVCVHTSVGVGGVGGASEQRNETNVLEATTDQKSCKKEEVKIEFERP